MEPVYAAREARVGHRAGVAHQALYCLRVYEWQAHLHLHQRIHLLKLQLGESETILGSQAKRLLLLKGGRWRTIRRRRRGLSDCHCRRLRLHPLNGLELGRKKELAGLDGKHMCFRGYYLIESEVLKQRSPGWVCMEDAKHLLACIGE